MRLQLDSSLAGAEAVRSEEIGQPAAAGPGSRRAGAGAQDTIQISSASSALNQLNTDRVARIQQLSTAVRSGSYNIAGSLIASAMVRDAAGASSGGK